MRSKLDLQLIAAKGEELQKKLRRKFKNVNIKFVSGWLGQEDEEGRYGSLDAQGYLWIRGDPDTVKRATDFAEREASRVWEEDGIFIVPRPSQDVWCARSEPLIAQTVIPGKDLTPYAFYYREDARGVRFWCSYVNEHEHDWGNVMPKL